MLRSSSPIPLALLTLVVGCGSAGESPSTDADPTEAGTPNGNVEPSDATTPDDSSEAPEGATDAAPASIDDGGDDDDSGGDGSTSLKSVDSGQPDGSDASGTPPQSADAGGSHVDSGADASAPAKPLDGGAPIVHDASVGPQDSGSSGTDATVPVEPLDSGPPVVSDASPSTGHILAEFPVAGSSSKWARATPVASSPIFTLAAALDPQSAGSDQWAGLSRDGASVAFVTTRFNCMSGDCLALAAGDGSNAALVEHVAGTEIVAVGRPAVASGGALIVYPARTNGTGAPSPHNQDLYAIRKTSAGWGLPVLLTGQMSALDSANVYAHDVALSYDDTTVVFDCGVSDNQVGPQDTCVAATDGSSMSILVAHNAGPGGNRHDLYPPPRPGPRWHRRLRSRLDWRERRANLAIHPGAGGTPGSLTQVGAFDDDNSPCVLPDGRIASLWLNRPGNTQSLHELKIMNADGSNPIMAVIDEDIVDVGQGCGK